MAFQLTARTMSSPSPGRRPAFSHVCARGVELGGGDPGGQPPGCRQAMQDVQFAGAEERTGARLVHLGDALARGAGQDADQPVEQFVVAQLRDRGQHAA